ncbi:MAG: tRNA (adenosine(37)-N6)-threonylcarbamoyltransferase complex dimerization subunit type 1 TsaB [Caulobacteraceae bacterium]
MIILAIDTCLAACQAVAMRNETTLALMSEPMIRGHQERLAPMVGEVVEAAGLSFGAIEMLAVTVGPGSFTGLRVGLAFAKGLCLALSRPLAGVGVLEAMAASTGGSGPRAAVIDAGRGRVYLQLFVGDAPAGGPETLALQDAVQRLDAWAGKEGAVIIGPGAIRMAHVCPALRPSPMAAPDPRAIARLAMDGASSRPAIPIYLRAPDARPKGG